MNNTEYDDGIHIPDVGHTAASVNVSTGIHADPPVPPEPPPSTVLPTDCVSEPQLLAWVLNVIDHRFNTPISFQNMVHQTIHL